MAVLIEPSCMTPSGWKWGSCASENTGKPEGEWYSSARRSNSGRSNGPSSEKARAPASRSAYPSDSCFPAQPMLTEAMGMTPHTDVEAL